MWDKTMPQSEANQRNEMETADVGKYFQIVTEGGKQYSKCSIKNCGRRLPGNQIANLETHLNVAHNMNFHSTPTERPDVSSIEDVIESVAYEVEQNLSESADVRKYFQLITDDGRPYSKCLIKNCMRRISGNHLNNLKRHLKAVHDANSNPWSSDDDDEMDNRVQLSGSEGTAENEDTTKVRQHFRIIIEDGKIYSKCLLRGCKRRLAGNHLHNMKRHLNHGHNMKVDLKPRKDSSMGPRKFFQRVEADGKLFSKCLIKDCDRHLPGDDQLDMERHLETVHDIKSYSASTKNLTSGDGPVDEVEVENPVGNDSVPVQELSSILATDTFDESIVENTSLMCKDARKYFQCITENGKSYARCLIRNCDRRIESISKEKLTRHLCIAHKMSSEISDARSFFESDDIDGKMFSVCLIQNCTRRIVGNHLNNLKKHLRGAHDMIIKPSCREMKSEMEDARKYFETVTENGKLFSKCLMDDCDCRIAGNHLYNLKRHLTKHNIHINSAAADNRNDSESDGTDRTNDGNYRTQKAKSQPTASGSASTCRLCFKKKENALDIFSQRLNIADVIRLHFPGDAVSQEDLLPKFVCSACWAVLSNFHKFYLSVNHAQDNYLHTIEVKETPRSCESSSESRSVSCKVEPTDTDEHTDDDKDACDAKSEKKSFATVFCEVFIPDCDIKMQETADEASRQRHTRSKSPQPSSRHKMATRRKSERANAADKDNWPSSAKRPGDCLDSDLICEFCGKLFPSFNEAHAHYGKEHSFPDGNSNSSSSKRAKR